MFHLFNKRNVTLDTNVLIAYSRSKDDGSLVKKVVTKSNNDDKLMITDVIIEEWKRYCNNPDANFTKKDVKRTIKRLNPTVVLVKPLPSDEELAERYKIRDGSDFAILYSVDMTDSEILVTYDDDFFAIGVEGIEAEILDPVAYLYEKEIKSGEYKPSRPKQGRIKKISKRDKE